MINTIIIDTQKNERDKLASLIAANGETRVIAFGKDAYDAVKLAGNLKPGVLILNNQRDFIEGEDLPLLVRARSPSTAVIIVTSTISDLQLYRALSNEVSGLLQKESDLELLPDILKYISEGGYFISPKLGARVTRLLSGALGKGAFSAGRFPAEQSGAITMDSLKSFCSGKDPFECIAKREICILILLGQGKTYDEIAKKLELSTGTVRNYISSIIRKTGLRNKLQLVCYAMIWGLTREYTFD